VTATVATSVLSATSSALSEMAVWYAQALASAVLANWVLRAVSVDLNVVGKHVSCSVLRIQQASSVLEMVLAWSQQAKQRARVKMVSWETVASTNVLV